MPAIHIKDAVVIENGNTGAPAYMVTLLTFLANFSRRDGRVFSISFRITALFSMHHTNSCLSCSCVSLSGASLSKRCQSDTALMRVATGLITV